MKDTSTWAEKVLNRIGRSARRIHLLNEKMKAYDRATWWRRMRVGGIIYRAFLEYCYMAELDDYVSADLELRE